NTQPNSAGPEVFATVFPAPLRLIDCMEAMPTCYDRARLVQFRDPFPALANKPGAAAAEIAAGPFNSELVQKPAGIVLEPDPSPRRAELLHERPGERRRVITGNNRRAFHCRRPWPESA